MTLAAVAATGESALRVTGTTGSVEADWLLVHKLARHLMASGIEGLTTTIPTYESVLVEFDPLQTTWATDPRFKVPYDQLQAAPDVPTSVGPVVGPLLEVRTVTAQGVAAIFGGADVASTLADSASKADALIADYNSRNG